MSTNDGRGLPATAGFPSTGLLARHSSAHFSLVTFLHCLSLVLKSVTSVGPLNPDIKEGFFILQTILSCSLGANCYVVKISNNLTLFLLLPL